MESYTVMGFDPGSNKIGFCVLEVTPDPVSFVIRFVASGVCKYNSTKNSLNERLGLISQDVERLVKEYRPQRAAVEKTFVGSMNLNKQTAIILAEARGAMVATISRSNIPVEDYVPQTWRRIALGAGNAKPEIVKRLMSDMFGAGGSLPDEYDARGIALALAREIQSKC